MRRLEILTQSFKSLAQFSGLSNLMPFSLLSLDAQEMQIALSDSLRYVRMGVVALSKAPITLSHFVQTTPMGKFSGI